MGCLFGSTRNTRFLKGGSLEERRFIRSDAPEKLVEEEIQWLIEHHILTVVDLRQEHEVADHPCLLSQRPEFTYHNIPVTSGNAVPASQDHVAPAYLKMVDATMYRIIDIIESSAGGALYFCAAGKDRTGVVSALLLSRAGATRQEIVDDYTETYTNLKDLIEIFGAENPDIDINIITPQAVYMELFLDNVKIQ